MAEFPIRKGQKKYLKGNIAMLIVTFGIQIIYHPNILNFNYFLA